MKRQLPVAMLLFVGLFSVVPGRAGAQDPVAAAAREELVENYRSLSSKVSGLVEEIHSYQSRISKLTDEIYKLRDEVDRLKNRNENAATLEKINRLQDAIKQVDEKRLEDNKRILADMASLRSVLDKAVKGLMTAERERPTPSAPPKETEPKTTEPPAKPPSTENSSAYVVKKGDTLSGIHAVLKKEKYKVTLKQIQDANPKVNWDKLQVGQTIIIPVPPPSNQ